MMRAQPRQMKAQPRRQRRNPIITAFQVILVFDILVTFILYTRVADPHGNTSASAAAEDSSTDTYLTPLQTLQQTFPIPAQNDTTVIPHPGWQARQELNQRYNTVTSDTDSIPSSMTVPKFFDESHGRFYGGSIRLFLANGKELLSPQQAAQIGSTIPHPSLPNHHLETIFISLANYRDPECPHTIEDIMARAEFPQRIRIAVIDQYLFQHNDTEPICQTPLKPCSQDPNQALCRYSHLMEFYPMDARLAVGPVFARHLGHRFYRGEYFALQMDSHVRLTKDWDTITIDQWKAAQNEYAVLTTYVSSITSANFDENHVSRHKSRPIMCQSDFEDHGDNKHLRHGQQPEGPPGIHGQPMFQPFWAAGFSFARGHFLIQVPYDNYLPMVFQGEEISMGLRGFTYGYDYYAPEQNVCFHIYASADNGRKKVPKFWENGRLYRGVGTYAMKRLNAVIAMKEYPAEDYHSQDVASYGIGQVRPAKLFWDTFGIDIVKQTVEGHLCRFVGKPMFELFRPAVRSNRMGVDYNVLDHFQFVDKWKNEKED